MGTELSRATAVVVFARAPRAGATKTRLIPALGAEGAARLHARMVEHAVRTAADASVGPVTLACAPDAAHPLFSALAEETGCALETQAPGDLGARMHAALSAALRTAPAAILIGSDCPSLTAACLADAAARLLAGDDVVLGPALDGGYVLVGCRQPRPALFRDIPWGGPEVLARSRDRLREAGLRWSELAARGDIDEPGDLVRLPAGWLAAGEAAAAGRG